jgi:hypothetical protein
LPTYDAKPTFLREYARLSTAERAALRTAIDRLVADLRRGEGFRPGLRVKGVSGHPGVFEMTWAPDGRATFEYGEPVLPGHVHIVWRRCGSHEIFERP